MKAFSRSEEAFTGLEAAIVLIAFVVVAAVFSYVVLGAGFFTTQKSQEVVHSGVEAASSNIAILGDVYGRNGTVGSQSAIGSLNFTIGLAAGATSIDIDRITMTYANASFRDEIRQTFTPYGSPPVGRWTVITYRNGDTDSLLETGEQIDVAVTLVTGHYIVMNDPFTLEVSPGVGSTLTISKKGPMSVERVQALY
ncbi:MAG: flagellin [Methanomicrobiales archaeon]|nr:flagellin [Methanomicrobiales archaeon]